ncbi:MAG: hypothetical protein HWE39_25410 [Oceanospirillaceae bacterium]|nr:hypothetical protein [Oceanospirillaceae bacterium]
MTAPINDTVALIGFSAREQNLLEVFFSGSDARGLTLQNPERASALLINMDTDSSLRSFRTWAEDRKERRPVIAVVDSETVPDGLIALPRPLTLTALKQALHKLRGELKLRRDRAGTAVAAGADKQHRVPGAETAATAVDQDTFRAVVAEARLTLPPTGPSGGHTASGRLRRLLDWSESLRQELEQQSCGSLPDLDVSREPDRRRLEFRLQGSFLAAVLKAVSVARKRGCATQVLGVPGALIYFPGQDCFSYDLDPELLLQMTRARFGPDELRTAERADLTEPRAASAGREELLWFVALMSARGRLPAGMRLDHARQLQRMPDFSRLLRTPHGNSIAELWRSSPHSALDVATLLGVPQRCVISFMVAAEAAGLFKRKQGARNER